MTTKYLLASIAINSVCIAALAASPLHAPLSVAILGGTLLHLVSSTFRNFLTAKRVLVIYYSTLLAAAPFLLVYLISRPQLPSTFQISNMGTFIFAIGLYLAIAFRLADVTIGQLNRHVKNAG